MEDCRSYTVFSVAAGHVGVLGTKAGLQRVTLPQPTEAVVRKLLGIDDRRDILSTSLYADLADRLQAYYRGHRVDFQDTLDLAAATAFQRSVWQATRPIPYGETRSYGWVAGQIGQPGALRAVGQALGRNPLPVIIPCHRVVGSNGEMGGFSGGLEMKRFLLRLESPG
jgi:methylated-DNA-[protein]-cysteine S-methyltransferase